MNNSRTLFLIVAALVALLHPATAIQTGRVELGIGGAYDGTVAISRNSSGSLTFRDQAVATTTLSQILAGRSDHGQLTGLADDDHTHYLNDPRHWQTHTAAFNDELPIPPDVANNSTLGRHTEDGNIHVLKNAAEIIAGAWRFTGAPVFVRSLQIEPQTPGPVGSLDFGTGYNSPRLSYLGNYDEFEFTRPIRATSGSLTSLVGSAFRVYATLDGRGLSGQPAAALTNFASVNGIAAGNLLDRTLNEDVSGQWDFLTLVRMFDDLSFEDATASGSVTTPRLILDGGGALATTSALTIKNLGAAPTRGIDLSNSGLSGSGDYFLYANANNQWRADGWLNVGGSGIYSAGSVSTAGALFGLYYQTNGGGDTALKAPAGKDVYFAHPNNYASKQLAIDATTPTIKWLGQPYRVNQKPAAPASGDAHQYLTAYTSNLSSVALVAQFSNGTTVTFARSDGGIKATSISLGQNAVIGGNLALTGSNKKLTIPDGADGPFMLNINPAAAFVEGPSDFSPAQYLPYPTFGSTGAVFFAFPVPADVLGANVVLDRITIACEQSGGSGTIIDEVDLLDDAGNAVVQYTGDITSTQQILSADYAMDDNKSYLIKILFVNSGLGAINLYRFKIEYHLE